MKHPILFFVIWVLTCWSTVTVSRTLLIPDLSPEAVGRMFTSVGFVTGAIRDIEGSRIRVKSIRVESKDKWLVIHILPERLD